MILVLKRKPIIFLHAWHHCLVIPCKGNTLAEASCLRRAAISAHGSVRMIVCRHLVLGDFESAVGSWRGLPEHIRPHLHVPPPPNTPVVLATFLIDRCGFGRYYYYCVSLFGVKLWWKKHLTKLQISQFAMGAPCASLYLYYHILGKKPRPLLPSPWFVRLMLSNRADRAWLHRGGHHGGDGMLRCLVDLPLCPILSQGISKSQAELRDAFLELPRWLWLLMIMAVRTT